MCMYVCACVCVCVCVCTFMHTLVHTYISEGIEWIYCLRKYPQIYMCF